MNLIRRPKDNWSDPFDFVRELQHEMTRALGTSLARSDNDFWTHAFEPDIEVREEADRFVVQADLPGIKKEELDISVVGDTLTIKGERKQEQEKKEKGAYYSERVFGSFVRTLKLSSDVDSGKVQASYKDGVLDIELPKAESAKPKQIKVDIK